MQYTPDVRQLQARAVVSGLKYQEFVRVRLVECVGRTQGLILAPGNPLHIRELADLAREGLRYVILFFD